MTAATTAEELAHDIASDWLATLSSTTAYGVLTVDERRSLKDAIANGLTTFSELVREEAFDEIEECIKMLIAATPDKTDPIDRANHVGMNSALTVVKRIRALSPTTETT